MLFLLNICVLNWRVEQQLAMWCVAHHEVVSIAGHRRTQELVCLVLIDTIDCTENYNIILIWLKHTTLMYACTYTTLVYACTYTTLMYAYTYTTLMHVCTYTIPQSTQDNQDISLEVECTH